MDAIRVLAITLVLLMHCSLSPRFPLPMIERGFLHLGKIGVLLFFVLSGYLQTRLLLADEKKFGQISLRLFYCKRLLRILPTMAVYLGFVFVWWKLTKYQGSWTEFAGTLLCFRQVFDAGSLTAHFWSLSIEVLFYLSWPFMLKACEPRARQRMVLISFAALAIAPWLINAVIPDTPHLYLSRAFEVGPIFFGCWLALSEQFEERLDRKQVDRSSVFILCCSNLFGASLLIDHFMLRASTFAAVRVGELAEGLLAGCFVYAAMRIKTPSLQRLFAHPVIRFIALISFGIYVWQQFFFFGNPNDWIFKWPKKSLVYPVFWFPLNILAATAAGTLSYLIIEKQFAPVRERITEAIIRKRKSSPTVQPKLVTALESEVMETGPLRIQEHRIGRDLSSIR